VACADVFPSTPGTLRRFAELFLARLGAFDGLAVWHNPGESRILSRHAAQAKRFALESLEPYFFSAPWSAQLAGKRVLVVHPFAETIRAQYARRTALWPGHPAVLPAFELEMLRWLAQRIMASHQRAPLDVVLLGCGAAGPPLAAFAKQLGAIGIHTGGPTQLLFGIHGRRWDRLPQFQGFFNDAWLRPDAAETPVEAGTVDQGGYW
jgi:hypothetical protein